MEDPKLHPELVQMMFYGSKEQILTLDNIRGCIEMFLFDHIKIDFDPFVSSIKHGLAGNIISTLEGLGYSRLRKEIKKTFGDERGILVDQQVAMIAQAVALRLSESSAQPEKMMLEKLQG